MSKFFSSVISLSILSSSLFSWFVPGTLTLTFNPQDSGGTSGTWQAVVNGPLNDACSSDAISYSSTDPVSMTFEGMITDFVEFGTYTIELKSNIVNPTAAFLSSITLQATSDYLNMDTITFKCFPVLASGENSMIFYAVPTATYNGNT